MSDFYKEKFLNFLNKYFPYFSFILFFFGLFYVFLFKNFKLFLFGIYFTIPAMISSLFLIYNRKPVMKLYNLYKIKKQYITIIFYVNYIISLLLLFYFNIRTIYYFISLTSLYLIIIIMIFNDCYSNKLILFKIILTSINYILSFIFKFGLYYSDTDLFGHINYYKYILIEGHIAGKSIDVGYHYYPLYHIYNAIISILTNNYMLYHLYSNIPLLFSILIVYLLFLNITKDDRISLITTLLYSCSKIILYYFSYPVTRVYSYFSFIFIIYFYIKNNGNEVKTHFLTSIIIFYTVMVHHASIFHIYILIILFIFSEYLAKRKINYSFILLFTMVSIFYWSIISNELTENIFNWTLNIDRIKNIKYSELVDALDLQYFIKTNVDTIIFIFYSIIGIGSTINYFSNKKIHVIIIFSFITYLLYVPNIIQTIWLIWVVWRFDRIPLFLSPFMLFSMSIGITQLLNKNRSRRIIKIFMIITLFISIFFSITNFRTSSDLEIIWPDSEKKYFTESELSGLVFSQNYYMDETKWFSDYGVTRYYQSNINNKIIFSNFVVNDTYIISRDGIFNISHNNNVYFCSK